ncbi:hypothetical protein D3C76_1652650 [compost metagenome]
MVGDLFDEPQVTFGHPWGQILDAGCLKGGIQMSEECEQALVQYRPLAGFNGKVEVFILHCQRGVDQFADQVRRKRVRVKGYSLDAVTQRAGQMQGVVPGQASQ